GAFRVPHAREALTRGTADEDVQHSARQSQLPPVASGGQFPHVRPLDSHLEVLLVRVGGIHVHFYRPQEAEPSQLQTERRSSGPREKIDGGWYARIPKLCRSSLAQCRFPPGCYCSGGWADIHVVRTRGRDAFTATPDREGPPSARTRMH